MCVWCVCVYVVGGGGGVGYWLDLVVRLETPLLKMKSIPGLPCQGY